MNCVTKFQTVMLSDSYQGIASAMPRKKSNSNGLGKGTSSTRAANRSRCVRALAPEGGLSVVDNSSATSSAIPQMPRNHYRLQPPRKESNSNGLGKGTSSTRAANRSKYVRALAPEGGLSALPAKKMDAIRANRIPNTQDLIPKTQSPTTKSSSSSHRRSRRQQPWQ
jgi:hypothetical protein